MPQFASLVPDSLARAVDALGGSGPTCLSNGIHFGQSVGEVAGLPVQENHSDCSRVAQHALVFGPSSHVESEFKFDQLKVAIAQLWNELQV